MTPDQLLAANRMDGYSNVYTCGADAVRVSFAAQQMRVLNLVWALAEKHPIENQRIAVLGAGLSGLTAAAALNLVGARVTLFERANTEMHLQRGNSTRHLHPSIIDWPSEDSQKEMTTFPILNWHAGMCNEVSAWIIEQWQELHDSVSVQFETQATIDGESEDTVYVRAGGKRLPFAFVVSCVGFGLEQALEGVPFLSYWDNDNLGRADLQALGHRRFLVCGAGDGALIDIARLLIADFDHERITEFVLGESTRDIRSQFARIESQMIERLADGSFGSGAQSSQSAGYWLRDQYSDLVFDPDIFRNHVRLRDDVSVTFCATSGCEYSLKAAAVHRFLLWILVNLDRSNAQNPRLQFLSGRAEAVKGWDYWQRFIRTYVRRLIPSAMTVTPGAKYKMRIGETHIADYDKVIVRTGSTGRRSRAPANTFPVASLDKPNPHYAVPYFSEKIVRFHNGRLEELTEETVFRHGCSLLPQLQRTLRDNLAVISLGYMASGAQFQAIVNRRMLVRPIPERFRAVPINNFVVPRERNVIVHDDLRPVVVNTLCCGMAVEFASDDTARLGIVSRIAFFVSVDGALLCVLPYIGGVNLGTKVYRQDLMSPNGFVGTVVEVHTPGAPEAAGVGCLLAELEGNFRVVNSFQDNNGRLNTDGTGIPLLGTPVLSHLGATARGRISRLAFTARIHNQQQVLTIASCFGIIPLTREPFATAADMLSLVLTETGAVVGVVVGTTLGQAAALPPDVFCRSINATLLTGIHDGPNYRPGIHISFD